MASQNISASFKNSDSSEIHDIPIVPPQPIARKEYKEIVPDISVISDIADNGSQLQDFQKNYLGHQTGSKYFQILSELKTDMIPKNILLSTPDNLLHRDINRISYQQQLEIDPCISKTVNDITEKTNLILDHNTLLPFKVYYNPACSSCITNCTLMTNKAHNGMHNVLPKNCASAPLSVGSEQSDKKIKYKSDGGEVISNKTCCNYMESNVTTSSSHKSVTCNHTHLSCASNSKEPEMPLVMDIQDCCSKDQHFKLRKSLSKCEKYASSDSGSGNSMKSEETCGKETIDRNLLKNRNILCPTCWKKTTCTCNFSAKKCTTNSSKKSDESVQLTEKFSGNANLHISEELSSIWEYLKRQDEKINLIHTKVSSFLSQHKTCCIDQPEEKNVPKVTESDIPYILNILEVHSDKIRELQDQINSLKSINQISSDASNNKIDESIFNQAQTINCTNIETCNENVNFPCCSHNVVCQNQTQKVTKTSTSTMTSFAIENNDKLVYHKQLTVVADVTREKKESSFLPKENDSPSTKSPLDVKNVNSNSHKRKSHKLKCSPRLKCKINMSSNSSSDVPDLNDTQALKTSHKSEKKSKHALIGNKVTDERHVNDLTMKDNIKERKSSPTLKIAATKSHSRSSKGKLKNNTSPKIVDKAIIRDLGNKKNVCQISTSSSSTDTEYGSPTPRHKEFDASEQDSEQESTTKSKYGLSSKYLSIATKTYLDKFQLHLDKNNRTDSS